MNKGFDWIGTVLAVIGLAMALVGIWLYTDLPQALMVDGVALLATGVMICLLASRGGGGRAG